MDHQDNPDQNPSQPPNHGPTTINLPPRGLGVVAEARAHAAHTEGQVSSHRSPLPLPNIYTGRQDPAATVAIQPTMPNQRALDKMAQRHEGEREALEQNEDDGDSSEEENSIGAETADHAQQTESIEDETLQHYPRSLTDIVTVSTLLTSLLPPELISTILELAEYWVLETVSRNTQLMIREANAGTVYLATAPVGERSGWQRETRETNTRSENGDVVKPASPGPVKKIVFTLRSHDQGWAHDSNINGGTYRGSWTWFEASCNRALSHTDGAGDSADSTSEPSTSLPFTQQPSQDSCFIPDTFPQPAPTQPVGPPTNHHAILQGPLPHIQRGGPLRGRGGPWRLRGLNRHGVITTPPPTAPDPIDTGTDARERRRRLTANVHATREDAVHVLAWNAEPSFRPEESTVDEHEGEKASEDAEVSGEDTPRSIARGEVRGGESADELLTVEQRNARQQEAAEWVRALQVGDVVNVEVWARFGGWCNHVGGCRIDVYLGL